MQRLVDVAGHVGEQQQRLALGELVRVQRRVGLALQDGDGLLQRLHDVVFGRADARRHGSACSGTGRRCSGIRSCFGLTAVYSACSGVGAG